MCEFFDYEEYYLEPEREQRKKATSPPDFEQWLAEKLAPPSKEREPHEEEKAPA